MADYKANREEKDALFRIIFGSEHPENALSLYNAINNTDYTNVEDVTVTTLRDALYVGVRNDVSFLFEHDMNLYEHQSTYCPNMPLRGFEYFHDLIKEYLGGDEHYEERVYSRRLQSIPRPKYYVFYNGTDRQIDREDLRLSDAYGGDGDIEVVAHVINVNAGHNDELLKRCKPMSDYSELIHRLRENLEKGMDKEGAVALAIDSCIEDGILSDLLRKEQARVMSTLVIGLTEEQKERMYAYEKECDVKEAREEGRAESDSLTEYLLSQNRIDDLKKALHDEDFRAKILSEMNK
jgi:hypothetical protein